MAKRLEWTIKLTERQWNIVYMAIENEIDRDAHEPRLNKALREVLRRLENATPNDPDWLAKQTS